jgi:hypothetical protein
MSGNFDEAARLLIWNTGNLCPFPPLRELGPVLERLELRLGERVVVAVSRGIQFSPVVGMKIPHPG